MAATKVLDKNNKWVIKEDNQDLDVYISQINSKIKDLLKINKELEENITKRENFVVVTYNASSDQTITNANTETDINLNVKSYSSGDLLTLNTTSHSVVVGEGVNHIEVSGSVYIATYGTAGNKTCMIHKNGVKVARTILYCRNNYQVITIPPIIVPATEGDEFTLVTSCNGTTTKIGQGVDCTRLVVKVID